MIRSFFQRLRAFRQDTTGLVSVEFAIYVPLLLWTFAAVYTLFDAFRQESINLKAAYTISDLISRETTTLNDDYIDSMHEMAKLLIRINSDISLRISVVRWDQDTNRYYVDWSEVRGTALTSWTDATISQVESNLPNMPDEERVILVETNNSMPPAFRIGLPDLNINNFVFSRPRFAPLVHFEGGLSSGGTHDDDTGGLDS